MGCLCSKEQLAQQQQHHSQQQQQQPPAGGATTLDALLAKLQAIGNTDTSDSSSPPPTGPVPQDVLDLVDEALQALQLKVVSRSGAAAAAQTAVTAAQPHVDSLAAVAAAVKDAIWDVKDGAFLSADAWQALGDSAGALLSAGTTLTYIGPVFALFSYAIKQWSTCQEVPQEAVDLLQSCRDLLFDLNQAWPHIVPQQQQQQQQQQERLQRWLRLAAEAAAECVVINSKGPIMRFALAEVHIADLASKADLLRHMRSQLSNLMEQAIADKADALGAQADALLAGCQRLMRLLPQYHPVPKLEGIEGRDELVKELHKQLLPGPGVDGMLLHGMGGAGKSTLATMLARHLQQSGAFRGGVFKVTVQAEVQYAADTDTLIVAQRKLLEQITGANAGNINSLDEGANTLADALCKTMEGGPVLLVIDNVPEGNGGILGLLPRNIETCVAEGSRVLFTSRNKAAEGLRLSIVTGYCVGSLSEDAAKRVLSDGAQLSHEQLQKGLKFCGGLPLALTLLQGALQGALRAGGSADSIFQRLDSGSISCDKQDKLWQALRFSVECLSDELRNTWLDLVQLHAYYRSHNSFGASTKALFSLFDNRYLEDLQQRNLVGFQGAHDFAVPLIPMDDVEVVVHDVLLCMADRMCGPDSDHYLYFAGDCFGAGPGHLRLPPYKGTCVGVIAQHINCTVAELPPLEHLRILWTGCLDDVAAVLSKGTNLVWLNFELDGSAAISLMPHGTAIAAPNLLVLDIVGGLGGAVATGNNLQMASLLGSMQMHRFRYMRVFGSSVWELPDTICQLQHLQFLSLRWCLRLKSLPAQLGSLQKMRWLDLCDCCSLTELPESCDQLHQLQELHLFQCSSLVQLPERFGQLSQLSQLDLMSCSSLRSLPASFTNLQQLRELCLAGCTSLQSLPDEFGELQQLQDLNVANCSGLRSLPKSFANLQQLQKLSLTGCDNLQSLPDAFGQLQQLQDLNLATCSSLRSLPASFVNLQQLRELTLRSCYNLQLLPDAFGQLQQLQDLDLGYCTSLLNLPASFTNLQQLQMLTLKGCDSLQDVPELFMLQQLQKLYFLCRSIRHLQVLPCRWEMKLKSALSPGPWVRMHHCSPAGLCSLLKAFGCLEVLCSLPGRPILVTFASPSAV